MEKKRVKLDRSASASKNAENYNNNKKSNFFFPDLHLSVAI